MGKLAGTIGTIAGAATGIPGGAQIGGALGNMIGGSGASQAASNYGNAQAQQMQAAQAAQFRPVGITTSFGKSNFTIDPTTGQLTAAGYELNPQLQALQTSLLGGYGTALANAQNVNTAPLTTGAQSLFNLGQGYLAQSPEEARQRYINQQNALLAPQQEQTLAGIRNRLFQSGRTGLATGGTTAGGMQATNPELAAYYNSLAQQQAQIAAGAEQVAQQQQTFGQGLLGAGAGLLNTGYGLQTAAYAPLQTQLGLGTSIEGMGQQALDLSAQLAGRQAQAGNNVADALFSASRTGLAGANQAANLNTQYGTEMTKAASSLFSNPQVQGQVDKLRGNVSSWFGNLIGDNTSTATPGYFGLEASGYNPLGFNS